MRILQQFLQFLGVISEGKVVLSATFFFISLGFLAIPSVYSLVLVSIAAIFHLSMLIYSAWREDLQDHKANQILEKLNQTNLSIEEKLNALSKKLEEIDDKTQDNTFKINSYELGKALQRR